VIFAEDESQSLSEIEKVQNPAFGAFLLWEFGRKYQSTSTTVPSHMLLYFLILPICLHRPTLNVVNSTLAGSGLGKFCEKIGKNREELLAIHERAFKLRSLTLDSIALGVRAGLFAVNYENGTVRSLEQKSPKVPSYIRPHVKGVVKLATWFEALEPVSVFTALKVEL